MGVPGAIEDIQPFAELAQNATTLVYKAYQKTLERFVLLKRLRPEFSSDPELARRFQDEARIVARVQHPNVVAIYSYGSDDAGAYIVAEFVEGYDLEEILSRGRIPPHLAAYVLLESARGLKAAHDKDVLHRDLKPSNILVSHEGEVKLADFGLASISGSPADIPSEIRGTLSYLAPEQILGNAPDQRSDLFSLGATFYEMLTGRRAFPGSNPSEIFDSILHRDPLQYLSPAAGVDDRMIEIAAGLLAREADGRYTDAGELITDLEAWLAPSPVGREHLAAFVADPGNFVAPPPIRIVEAAPPSEA
ncbi:MAG: serine/threonine-protein kinase, partial [Rhodothermales bacterium]